MASVMSLVMMVFMAIPVIAPNIGQGIMLFGSWREIFVIVALFGAGVGIWAALRLPETLAPENRRELTTKRVGEAFRIVLTNRIAFGYQHGGFQINMIRTHNSNMANSWRISYMLFWFAINWQVQTFLNLDKHGNSVWSLLACYFRRL